MAESIGVAVVARATGLAVRKGRDEVRAGARPEDVVDLSLSDRSPADRSMGNGSAIEIDIGRAIDLSLSDRSPADRSMGNAIETAPALREAGHV